MNRNLVFFLLGRVALLNGLMLVIPLICAYIWQEAGGLLYFGPAIAATVGIGAVLSWLGRNHKRQLGVAEGAWYMACIWLLLGGIGMIPYILSGTLGGLDAFFESIAAWTTTGISCFAADHSTVPQSLLLWHSMMEWLGGLTFIVLLIAVIPQVNGRFGLTLTVRRNVSFSPLVSRMEQTARRIGIIYTGITFFSAALYWLAGISLPQALIQAMRTVSTSGGNSFFSFMAYNNPALELAGAVTMLLASGNFLLYWKGVTYQSIRNLFQDQEMRAFLALTGAAGLIVSVHLWYQGLYSLADSLRFGFFQVISFISTSGLVSAAFPLWPEFDQFILFILAFVGGCIGSLTGGIRIMRLIILLKMAVHEMRRILHPHMVVSLKLNGIPVEMKVISQVLSYFFLFMMVFFISMIILSLAGITPLQSMGLAIGCLSSVGATASLFGVTDFLSLPAWMKVYCSFLMILGRLEIFSFLIVVQMGLQSLHRQW